MASRRNSLLRPVLTLATVAIVGLIASWNNFFLLRVKPYSMPASSMEPTIEPGDMLLVEQFSPAFGTAKTPERGDIIVFGLPASPQTSYVKRLIGQPGDKVQMREGRLFLNGQPLATDKVDDYVRAEANGTQQRVQRYRETLPNGRVYEILDLVSDGLMDNTGEYDVPEGHVFVLGDNRDNSVDSRFSSQMGFVPVSNVSGIAQDIYFSGPEEKFTWRSVVETDLGTASTE